jgi:hypothetical protein
MQLIINTSSRLFSEIPEIHSFIKGAVVASPIYSAEPTKKSEALERSRASDHVLNSVYSSPLSWT